MNAHWITMKLLENVEPNKQTLDTIIMLSDDVKYYKDAMTFLVNFTEQAYNGLNKDAGDWAKELTAVCFAELF